MNARIARTWQCSTSVASTLIDEQGVEADKVKFKDDATLQQAKERFRQERCTSSICRGCGSIGRLNTTCLTCAMVGVGMRHSTPLTSMFEDEDEVNMVEDSKPAASEWLVDSVASIYLTNCKDDLNDPETTSQAVTIGSGKVIAAQFKGRKATILTDMDRRILE